MKKGLLQNRNFEKITWIKSSGELLDTAILQNFFDVLIFCFGLENAFCNRPFL